LNHKIIRTLKVHNGQINDIDWSSNNEVIATCSSDKTLKLISIETGETIKKISNRSDVVACLFHPVNNDLIMLATTKNIRICDCKTGKKIRSIPIGGNVKSMTFSSDGEMLFVGNDTGEIVWLSCASTTYNKYVIKGKARAANPGRFINNLVFKGYHTPSLYLPSLLVNAPDSSIKLLRFGKSKSEPNREVLKLWSAFPVLNIKGQIRSTFCPLLLSRDYACIISGSEDGDIYIYAYPTIGNVKKRMQGTLLNTLSGHGSSVRDVAWNSDESFLASGDNDGMLIIWKKI